MSTPDWRALFDQGVAFTKLAPWQWMGEVIFGVQVPGSNDIGWCVVLGSGGELSGLSVYLGDSGFDTFRKLHEDQGDDLDDFWGQDALTVLLGDRNEVSAKQRALFTEHGFKFRGRGAWPGYAEHRVGYVPRDLPGEKAGFLTECLRQAIAVCERAKQDQAFILPTDEGELFLATSDGDQRIPEPKPLPEPPVPQPDQVALGRIRARIKGKCAALEVGLAPLFAATIDGPNGAYMPAMAMIMDTVSGVVLAQNMSEPADRDHMLQELVMKAVLGAGARPEVFYVSSGSAARALAPVAEALDIPIELVQQLHMFEDAMESMSGFLGAGF